MRTTKYRAWVPQDKEFITWDSVTRGDWFWEQVRNGLTAEQYTGLEDKNGEDICEGDLLLFANTSGRICKVVWHEPSASFDAEFVRDMNEWSNNFNFKTADWPRTVEVIGSIYENPELLIKEKIDEH